MHGDGADELGGECEAYARKSGSDWEEGFAQPLRDKARDSRSKVGSWSEAAAEVTRHSDTAAQAQPRPPQQQRKLLAFSSMIMAQSPLPSLARSRPQQGRR